jgi:5,10-methenyltetrahydrofolate synthetase
MTNPPPTAAVTPAHQRSALRRQLLAARRDWTAAETAGAATDAVARQLGELLQQLEPQCLGVYWALDGEFNAAAMVESLHFEEPVRLALPYAKREGREMVYRAWDGRDPALKDECGIPSSAGAVLVPDVVLVPCVGFTRAGYRLGYGGGYFDRWLAQHPGVTSVGLAWSGAETSFAVEAHDQPLTLIVTEREVIAP